MAVSVVWHACLCALAAICVYVCLLTFMHTSPFQSLCCVCVCVSRGRVACEVELVKGALQYLAGHACQK